jgi:hypothetical protein
MRFLSFLALLTIISCGGGEVRRDVEDVTYQTSGTEKYFLPELTAWNNASASGQCFKSASFHYLDFAQLSASYQLGYPELLELQAQYNERLESYFRSSAKRFLKPVEEAAFFANTLEQVRGGVRLFRLPAVREVDLIWLDGFSRSNKVTELKKMAQAGRFDEKLPILFSACLSRAALSSWVAEQGLDQVGFHLISAEWLSPFGSSLALGPGLRLELSGLVPEKIKINFVSPDGQRPPELIFK